ncbi:MAG: lytic transglycosylase domain-containing protein [Bacteroidota bacterium]
MTKGITNRPDRRRTFRAGRFAAGLSLTFLLGAPAFADLYVYELPNGSRLIADHPVNNKHYRLVRASVEARGAGTLAAQKNSPVFRENPSTYDRLIRRYTDKYGVDFALVKAIMTVESAFNPYAVSNKGARGLMQVMPETAKIYGVQDVYDPVENVRAAVQHLKYLSEEFNNQRYLVIAAYNAGENAVRQYRGIPPYPETQNYVKKVLYYTRYYSAKPHVLAVSANSARN